MKKLKTVLLPLTLAVVLLPVKAQRTYVTSGTADRYEGQWTKIAEVDITRRYRFSNMLLELSGGYSGYGVGVAKLFFRVKQQAAFPDAPNIQLELIESSNLKIAAENFVAVHKESDGAGAVGSTKVDLYVQVSNRWEAIAFVPTLLFASDSAVFLDSQPFLDVLPPGEHYTARYADTFNGKGFFDKSVGIGVDAPEKALHIRTGDQDGVRIAAEGIPRLELDAWEGDELKANWVLYSRPSNGEFGIWDDNQRGNRFTIDSLGNIGVGTRHPAQKLHVSGGVGLFERTSGTVPLQVWDTDGDAKIQIGANTAGEVRYRYLGTDLAGDFNIYQSNGSTKHVTVKNTGKVGIGTTDPSAKLTVDGDILATKVKVVTDVASVPDYVFADDYDLSSLEEVADYIQANHHLPEVPSAAEMAASGQDLGEMNLLLLKKIEELTLYLIDQQEEIRGLRADLETFKTSEPTTKENHDH